MGRVKPGKTNILAIIKKNKNSHIISFGNYAGEYIEDVPDDYVSWLLEQDWFEEKYPKLFEIAEKLLDEQGLRDVY
jgi:uncharacterized protein (DUF3820 family)